MKNDFLLDSTAPVTGISTYMRKQAVDLDQLSGAHVDPLVANAANNVFDDIVKFAPYRSYANNRPGDVLSAGQAAGKSGLDLYNSGPVRNMNQTSFHTMPTLGL